MNSTTANTLGAYPEDLGDTAEAQIKAWFDRTESPGVLSFWFRNDVVHFRFELGDLVTDWTLGHRPEAWGDRVVSFLMRSRNGSPTTRTRRLGLSEPRRIAGPEACAWLVARLTP